MIAVGWAGLSLLGAETGTEGGVIVQQSSPDEFKATALRTNVAQGSCTVLNYEQTYEQFVEVVFSYVFNNHH